MACRYIKKNRHVMVCALAFAILAVAETRVVTLSAGHPVTFQIQVSGTADRTDFPVVDNGTVDPCVVPLPTDKLGLLAPYIGLAATILVVTVATPVQIKHVKRRKKLHTYGPSESSETTTATDPTTVNRSDPYDPGYHRMQIDTEIVSMSLTGNSTYTGSFATSTRAIVGAILATGHHVEEPVSGVVVPVYKFGLLDPYISPVSTTLIGAVAPLMYLSEKRETMNSSPANLNPLLF